MGFKDLLCRMFRNIKQSTIVTNQNQRTNGYG